MSDETPWTVWDVIRAQADRTPGEVAVVAERLWSYAELVEQVERLAETIGGYAGRGQAVAIDVTGPATGLVATLAVVCAGCAALPLSADSPHRHRELVLDDARPVLVMHEEGGAPVVRPTSFFGLPSGDDCLRDIAYVMYTSGSTGRPKGVLVQHAALVERLAGLAQLPGLGAGESMLAMTALSFDISMAEILLPLTVGGSVVAAPADARFNPEAFAHTVADRTPDVIQATPSFWRLAIAWGWAGAPSSRLWCGGEPLTPNLAENLLPRCRELWNVYGPTEATIWASASCVHAAEGVSLGEPLPGTGMFLAADDGQVFTDPGRPGQLVLYGAGLARGYLNMAELTAQRFRVLPTPDGPRMCYLTGDRAQYRADGRLEFLGRTDGQAKLRGHRIELGEIEAVLERCPGVSAAAAAVRDADRPAQAHIAVFVVAERSVTTRAVRTWLAEYLPSSMRPATVQMLAELPRTPAGKVDRGKLACRG